MEKRVYELNMDKSASAIVDLYNNRRRSGKLKRTLLLED